MLWDRLMDLLWYIFRWIKNKIYREKSIPMIAWCPAFSNLVWLYHAWNTTAYYSYHFDYLLTVHQWIIHYNNCIVHYWITFSMYSTCDWVFETLSTCLCVPSQTRATGSKGGMVHKNRANTRRSRINLSFKVCYG